MYHALTAAFPKITVISEEESKECDKVNISDLKDSMKHLEDYNIKDTLVNVNDVTVWIDPLDATKEFTGKKNLKQNSNSKLFSGFSILWRTKLNKYLRVIETFNSLTFLCIIKQCLF